MGNVNNLEKVLQQVNKLPATPEKTIFFDNITDSSVNYLLHPQVMR